MKAKRAAKHGFRTGPFLLLAALSFAAAGCATGQSPPGYSVSLGGNANVGKALIVSKGCGSCHIVPGIYTARGLVGPPLSFYSRRIMIAGELPNTPDNLVRWIKDPKLVEPETAMPDLGVTDQQARNITAYLYTLR